MFGIGFQLESKKGEKSSLSEGFTGKKKKKGSFADLGHISAQRKVNETANHKICAKALTGTNCI